MIKDWQNGRKLSNPKDFEKVRDMYVTPRYISDEKNEVLIEREVTRSKNKINQAR